MPREKKPETNPLDAVLEKIRKDRGVRIGSLAEAAEDVAAISTGNIAIDYVTAVGGLPVGRVIEAYGLQSSGKTTMSLQAAAAAQRAGGNVLFLDYENSMDPSYAAALGLDVNARSFIFNEPDTFEEGINVLRELIRSGQVNLAIVDSVAAMTTAKEMEAETGTAMFADKARMMAQTLRQLGIECRKYGTTVVFLNHVRDVIDTSAMGQKLAKAGVERKTTPGGTALKFHSSVRMHFKVIGKVTHEEHSVLDNEVEKQAYASKVLIIVEKNKVGPPFRQAEVRLEYGKGFSQEWSVLQVLIAHKVVKKSGAWLEVPDPETGELVKVQGEEKAMAEIGHHLNRHLDIARGLLASAPVEVPEVVPQATDEEVEDLLDA